MARHDGWPHRLALAVVAALFLFTAATAGLLGAQIGELSSLVRLTSHGQHNISPKRFPAVLAALALATVTLVSALVIFVLLCKRKASGTIVAGVAIFIASGWLAIVCFESYRLDKSYFQDHLYNCNHGVILGIQSHAYFHINCTLLKIYLSWYIAAILNFLILTGVAFYAAFRERRLFRPTTPNGTSYQPQWPSSLNAQDTSPRYTGGSAPQRYYSPVATAERETEDSYHRDGTSMQMKSIPLEDQRSSFNQRDSRPANSL